MHPTRPHGPPRTAPSGPAGGPAAQAGDGRPHPAGRGAWFNGRKVWDSGGVSALAVGGSFGPAIASVNLARAHLPRAAGVAPLALVAAGAASAYAEAAIRDRTGIQSTALPPARAYDVVAPAVFGGVNAAYLVSGLPKFKPASPQGVAATLAVSAVSTFLAGAGAEALAQGMRGGPGEEEPRPQAPTLEQTRSVAIGRAASMVPAAAFGRGVSQVLARGPLEAGEAKTLALLNTGALAGSWVFRGVLAPEPAGTASATAEGPEGTPAPRTWNVREMPGP